MSRASTRVGADEALETLVGQFADPLAFLRELVQNSLDAAASQIDVDFAFEPASQVKDPNGLMTITVADNGEGMNEHIIDNHLLTLFSSTKEDDLTKIGKFGVGFVSIFAIEPELVVLETAQAGESWRILFHADRSFEKLRLDEPLEGTVIALHKHVRRSAFADIEKRGADTVKYWCRYADAEICVNGEPVGEEFEVESPLSVRYAEPGTELVVGFAPLAAPGKEIQLWHDAVADQLAPTVGFYNRGLTLIEGNAIPGESYPELAGLSMRIRSRYLEHTLTRDNVRQDESFHKAMAMVRRAVDEQLAPALIRHLEALASAHSGHSQSQAPSGPPMAQSLLYARLPCMAGRRDLEQAAIFPTVEGKPLSVRKLRRSEMPAGKPLYASRSNPLTVAMAKERVPVVLALDDAKDYLWPVLGGGIAANSAFYTAVPVETEAAEQRMLAACAELARKAKVRISDVVLGELNYPDSPVKGRLFVRQDDAFEVTQIGEDDEPTLFGGARTVVVNASHPLVRRCRSLASSDPALAASILALGIARAAKARRARLRDVSRHGLRRAERQVKRRAESRT